MPLLGVRAYGYAISVLFVLAISGFKVSAQQLPPEIQCQDSSVTAALASLSQSIAQNQTAITNCTPPNALPSCSASQLATLNGIAALLNSEYQAELQNCRPVQPPPQAAVSVIGIEVTQVVQDMNESVPLIAGKQTWARVYLSTISPVVATGTLQIENSSFTITNVQSSAPPATLTPAASLQQMRQSWTASLNFLIPPS